MQETKEKERDFIQDNFRTKKERLDLPECYKKYVLIVLHNDCGHIGRDRTMQLMNER